MTRCQEWHRSPWSRNPRAVKIQICQIGSAVRQLENKHPWHRRSTWWKDFTESQKSWKILSGPGPPTEPGCTQKAKHALGIRNTCGSKKMGRYFSYCHIWCYYQKAAYCKDVSAGCSPSGCLQVRMRTEMPGSGVQGAVQTTSAFVSLFAVKASLDSCHSKLSRLPTMLHLARLPFQGRIWPMYVDKSLSLFEFR